MRGGCAVAELVTGKGGHSEVCLVDLAVVFLSIGIDEVFAIVLCAAADVPESTETRSCSGVGVNVDNLAALYVLEKSHCCVAGVVLDHVFVRCMELHEQDLFRSGSVLPDLMCPPG